MPDYRLTPAAERDLEGIWDYTARQWGQAQAEHYTDALVAVFQDLAADPAGAGSTACDHIRQGYRRRRVERHIVFFKRTAYGIAVVRILHERMDAPRHL